MKKKKQITLVVVMVISILLNLLFIYNKMTELYQTIQGTYQLKVGRDIECYLFDERNNYCRYTQKDGVLENGTYKELENYSYCLTSDDGQVSIVFLTKEGIDCWSQEMAGNIFYEKLDSVLLYYETATNEWPEWCGIYGVTAENYERSWK